MARGPLGNSPARSLGIFLVAQPRAAADPARAAKWARAVSARGRDKGWGDARVAGPLSSRPFGGQQWTSLDALGH